MREGKEEERGRGTGERVGEGEWEEGRGKEERREEGRGTVERKFTYDLGKGWSSGDTNENLCCFYRTSE